MTMISLMKHNMSRSALTLGRADGQLFRRASLSSFLFRREVPKAYSRLIRGTKKFRPQSEIAVMRLERRGVERRGRCQQGRGGGLGTFPEG